MQRVAKIGILVLVVVGLLVGGLTVAGAVEGDHATADQTRIVTALRPLIDDGTITESQAEAVAGRLAPIIRSERIRRDTERFRDRAMAVERNVADMLDMTVPELEDQLKDGATLAQIAESRGSSGEEIVAALVGELSERLADQVAEGRITQEQADEMVAAATGQITDLVESSHPGRAALREHRARLARLGALRIGADVLDMTPQDLRSALESGQSLGEIAQSRGVDEDALIDALLQPIREQVALSVERGRIDEDRAGEILDRAVERVRNLVAMHRG
ncbi:MAG: hypothetical protein GWP04_01850 [Gammaproteobacteria bacterium]|nr:hypothetical protein [Gammaproteobacteria bacterium]